MTEFWIFPACVGIGVATAFVGLWICEGIAWLFGRRD